MYLLKRIALSLLWGIVGGLFILALGTLFISLGLGTLGLFLTSMAIPAGIITALIYGLSGSLF